MAEFYAKSAGGGGEEMPVLSQTAARASGVMSANVQLSDSSPDGRSLLFSTTQSSDYDLWLVPLEGDPKPVRFLSVPGDQWHGNFSPMAGWWRIPRTSLAGLKSMFRPFP